MLSLIAAVSLVEGCVVGGAFACAVVTGLVFGFMLARKASGLDPVVVVAGQ